MKPELPSTYISYVEHGHEDVHLRDYVGVIMKRRWVVLVFFVSVVVATTILTLLMTPLYRSTAVIKIDKENQDGLSFAGVHVTSSGTDYYETQYEILKSRSLASRVIRKMGLDRDRNFIEPRDVISTVKGMAFSWIRNALSAISSAGSGDQGKNGAATNKGAGEEYPPYLINSLISRLNVTPVKNSQLVKVSFLSHRADLSQDIANAVADAYIEYDLESRVDASRQARDFLANQIEITKEKVEKAERALNDYASRNSIIFLDSDKSSVLNQKLSETTSALSTVSAERMQKEALYRQIRETGSENPVILNNPLIQNLKNDHARLEAEYFNLSRTFTPDYPKMKNLKSQIDSISERIEKEKDSLIRSIESDYYAAYKKENYLKSAFDSQQKKVLEFQGRAVEYQTLKREIEGNKALHNSLLQKLNEVGVAAMSKATNIQVVDRAVFPREPYKPDKPLNILLSVIFGLAGGIGLAFLMDYFDNTIKDTQEIERRMHLPSLGMIPHQAALHVNNRPRIAYADSPNQVTEAFRSIGTFILLSSSSRPPRTILVTSPGEKEGKTTICINIAMALADSLGSGIIIDADLRRPRLHHSFDVDNKTGLSSNLSGLSLKENDSRLIKQTSVKGLDLITSGPVPPNPSKLLFSPNMKDLLDALSLKYNFVIIDAPPVMGMPDSVLLSRLVDGTILVVKAGETQKDALSATKQILDEINTNLIGVILNGVKKDDLKYGYYSNYFSSYFKEAGS